MGKWPTLELGELAATDAGAITIGPFGSRMKADCYVPYGVPVIRGTNISETRSWKGDWVFVSDEFADTLLNCNVKKDDLVFPHRGSIGEVAIVPGDRRRYMLSTSLMKFRADRNKAHPLFLFYYFRSSIGRSEILRFSSQVGTPGIGQPLSSMRQFRVTVPPLETQAAIANLLSTLDDKIELNRQTNATLEAMARALFKDWFVDFGPTRAKAEGRVPYLASHLWELFPDALDDEDKPVGWDVGELHDIVELNPRESLKKGSDAPYLDMAALPTSGPIPEKPIPRPFSSGMRFRNGDTLLARITPCLENGKTAFVQSLPDNTVGWGSTEFIVLRAKSPVPESWTYLLARDPMFRAHAIQSMTGTSGRQRASSEALAAYPVTIPDAPIWQAFGNLIGPMFTRIKAAGAESETLAQTRDLLLPKLMSGEIRLREAERIAEAAL